MATAPDAGKVVLKSSDEELFYVKRDVIRLSTTIDTMLKDLGVSDEADLTCPIPMPNISGSILKKVIEWCSYHECNSLPRKDSEPCCEGTKKETEEEEKAREIQEKWDAEFLNVDNATLFELITAANFLDVKGLLDLTCGAVSKMLVGKSVNEIRTILGIENDFTPEEEEQVRGENVWCSDG